MNKASLVIFVLLFGGAIAAPAAQDDSSREQKIEQAQQRFQEMKERLQLTPEQTEQVRPIVIDELQQMKAVREKYSGDQNRRARFQMAREMRGIREAADEKLKKILSKKQMDELKKIREERREEFRNRAHQQR